MTRWDYRVVNDLGTAVAGVTARTAQDAADALGLPWAYVDSDVSIEGPVLGQEGLYWVYEGEDYPVLIGAIRQV